MKYFTFKTIGRIILPILFTFILFANNLFAQSDSKGKDFWLMFTSNHGSFTPEIFFYITSDVNTSGTISGASFTDIPFTITANTVTEISVPVALQSHTSDVIDNTGIHIVSDDDVSVYGLNRYPQTTDAFLGLPSDVLGTDYIVLSYGNSLGFGAVQFGIVATVDNTTVTITPSVTTGSYTAGTPYDITLDQGEVYQLQNTSSTGDLTGTTITSDNPIGVFGGHSCANIPTYVSYCDMITEMLPPTTTFGTQFGAVPLAVRSNGDTWRFMASQDGTTVNIDGTPQSSIDKGQFVEVVLTNSSYITSDKPILAAQYANGSNYSGDPGDPLMMLIPPLEQFLASYTLTTTAGYTAHYVNLIAPNSITSSVLMDGSPISSSEFSAIGSSGFSGAQIEVTEGSHTFSAPLPFGAFQYGFNFYDSYGYPGGQSFSPVATVSALALSPSSGNSEVFNNNCWYATVTDNNNDPVVGVKVDFNISGANPGSSSFAITDANGVAEYCYFGTNSGNDTIVASIGNISGSSVFTWNCTAPVFTSYPADVSSTSKLSLCD